MSTSEVIFAIVGVCLTITGIAVAAAQVWVAVSANKQTQLAQEAADRQRLSDDKRFALAICEPLATPEVHAILNDPAPSAEHRAFIQTLYQLCSVKVEALLSPKVKDDRAITDPIDAVLEPVQAFLDQQGVTVDSSRLDEKLGTDRTRSDHTKYAWEGSGRHSKIWMVNLIAQRWAETQQLTTRAAFERSFGEQLRAAVPDRAGEFQSEWLLITDPTPYLPELLLTLDGVAYGVHWRCGFKNVAIGTGVQKPVIEYFAATHGFPAVGL